MPSARRGAGDTATPAHWGITFAVNDADEAATAMELACKVLSEPTDLPWVHTATIEDPLGATFVASQFVLENEDLASAAPRTATRSLTPS